MIETYFEIEIFFAISKYPDLNNNYSFDFNPVLPEFNCLRFGKTTVKISFSFFFFWAKKIWNFDLNGKILIILFAGCYCYKICTILYRYITPAASFNCDRFAIEVFFFTFSFRLLWSFVPVIRDNMICLPTCSAA